jgi:hypothetical protein
MLANAKKSKSSNAKDRLEAKISKATERRKKKKDAKMIW